MSLQKGALASGIKSLMDDMAHAQKPSHDEYANRLADLIDTYVRTGTVIVQPGIAVATTGSATAQTGATTATGTGTIN
jgi:hypothetical protein